MKIMHLKSFIGGIHPKDQKHYTKDLPIIKLNASDEVVFLLKQHIGAPCKPLVKIKDEVKVGQKLLVKMVLFLVRLFPLFQEQ